MDTGSFNLTGSQIVKQNYGETSNLKTTSYQRKLGIHNEILALCILASEAVQFSEIYSAVGNKNGVTVINRVRVTVRLII